MAMLTTIWTFYLVREARGAPFYPILRIIFVAYGNYEKQSAALIRKPAASNSDTNMDKLLSLT
jgi:hypothetical protein